MFKIYCNNCGLKADPEDLFCSKCGKRLKNIFELKEDEPHSSNFIKLEAADLLKSYSSSYKNPNGKTFSKKGRFVALALICIFGCILTVCSALVFDVNSPHFKNSPDPDYSVDKEKNIQVCKQIASEYYKTHEYSEDDIYDCDNMAQDIWNMLKAKGINARIAAGDFKPENTNRIKNSEILNKNLNGKAPEKLEKISNLSYIYPDSGNLDSEKIDNLTHAWVLAEISPDSWLAIECTGGYVVESRENESYYHGLTFSNPRNYRIFFELYSDWKTQAIEYENERLSYNKLIEAYNNASYSEQTVMRKSVEFTEERLHEKEEKFLKTDSELKALLQYG